MNKMIIIGNLTKAPEMRATPSGRMVCNFDVAVNDRKNESTTYFRVSAWDKIGESCQRFLSKGRKVFVSGPLSARTYQVASGDTRVSLEINAVDVEFLSPKDGENSYQQQERSAIQHEATMTPVETDELPF